MSTIEERVKKIVAEQLGAKAEDVTNSASFVDYLFSSVSLPRWIKVFLSGFV